MNRIFNHFALCAACALLMSACTSNPIKHQSAVTPERRKLRSDEQTAALEKIQGNYYSHYKTSVVERSEAREMRKIGMPDPETREGCESLKLVNSDSYKATYRWDRGTCHKEEFILQFQILQYGQRDALFNPWVGQFYLRVFDPNTTMTRGAGRLGVDDDGTIRLIIQKENSVSSEEARRCSPVLTVVSDRAVKISWPKTSSTDQDSDEYLQEDDIKGPCPDYRELPVPLDKGLSGERLK